MSKIKWAYGVTTIPSRATDGTMDKTLTSLCRGGFGYPRLFVDGELETGDVATVRYPSIHAFGNWYLALLELYIRNPLADRYAIFQDDILVVRNLRSYLNQQILQSNQWWNLYTAMRNYNDKLGASPKFGWHESDQQCRGALALVFSRPCVQALLGAQWMIGKAQDTNSKTAGRDIDGSVARSLRGLEFTEFVHHPSLVMHNGEGRSTVGTANRHPSPSFPGEDFDAKEWL